MTCVEIAAQAAEDAIVAGAAGAHRLELCSALVLHGLTPSVGLVRTVRASTRLPIMAMVRPREGGFAYSESEFHAMEADVEAVLSAGADGVVTGLLHEDGRVDERRCRALIARANGRPVVFHRAFDGTPDPFEAMEMLIGLGFTRILTAGGTSTAMEGADRIRSLVEQARERIEILAGGGIRASNVRRLVGRTGVGQVHLAPREPCLDPTGLHFGGYDRISAAAVAEVVAAINS